MDRVEEIIQELESFRFDEDALSRLEGLMEELRNLDRADRSLAPILRLIESNPDEDIGMPGPLVHFAEEYYRRGYERALLESIGRRPTSYSLWMLNRLINGSSGEERRGYFAVMQRVAQDPELSPEMRNLARELLTA